MISNRASNMLGLVELVDSDGLCDTYGPHAFEDLKGVFVERLIVLIRNMVPPPKEGLRVTVGGRAKTQFA